MAATRTAQEALDLVGRDPRDALELADAIVAGLPRPRTPEAVREVATAHRAAGLALRSIGDPAVGAARMRRGIAVADRNGLDDVAAEVRMSAAFVLLDLGRPRAALASVDQALAVLRGQRAARARVIRALVLQRTGRMRQAMEEYAAAGPVLRRAGDRDWEARLRHNRALLLIELGETREAVADLEWTRSYDLESGHTTDAADALFNIGVAMESAGDVPAALALYERAVAEWDGVPRPELLMARVEAYLQVGLVREATENARVAVGWLAERGWDDLEAQAHVRLAGCLLSGDAPDLDGVLEHATIARTMFSAQGRKEAQDRADYLALKARILARPTSGDLDRVADVATRLQETGGGAEAADLRITAGRAALEIGDARRARTLLGPLCAMERSRSLEIRSRAWLARALLSQHQGDLGATQRELRSAWSVIEQQRARLGATELRSASGALAEAVTADGLRIALAGGSAATTFDWAERRSAAALRYRPATPPADPELARVTARLRWAAHAEFEAQLDGEPDPRAQRVRSQSEAELLRISRRARGSTPLPESTRAHDVRRLLADDEVFLHLLETDGTLSAVVVTSTSTAVVPLGSTSDATAARDAMHFSLRRTLTGFSGGRHARAAYTVAHGAAAELDLLVGDCVRGTSGPVIVRPTASLVGLPWAMLPSLRSRAVTVAPSAAVWARARRATPITRHAGLVAIAGPGLPGAMQEARAIAALRPDSLLLTGEDATPARVLDALSQAAVVHIAAHGTLRVDNPLFSTIQLSSGAITGYDMETAGQTPDIVTMSACSSGAGHASAAEETLGFAWTLMGMGTRHVVAPLLSVPDEATGAIMVALHRELADDVPPAEALARSRRQAEPGGVPDAVAGVLVSYGC